MWSFLPILPLIPKSKEETVIRRFVNGKKLRKFGKLKDYGFSMPKDLGGFL
jgi:hypothetical protein